MRSPSYLIVELASSISVLWFKASKTDILRTSAPSRFVSYGLYPTASLLYRSLNSVYLSIGRVRDRKSCSSEPKDSHAFCWSTTNKSVLSFFTTLTLFLPLDGPNESYQSPMRFETGLKRGKTVISKPPTTEAFPRVVYSLDDSGLEAFSFSRAENSFLCVKPTLLGLPHYALARDVFSKAKTICIEISTLPWSSKETLKGDEKRVIVLTINPHRRGIGVQKAIKKAKLVERRPEKLKLASPGEDLKDLKLAILLAGFWASPLGLLTTFHSNR
ncbi:hypothetical protein WN944_019022 [Citrus x changshan-huyou]|uniref:Uncharacterized protein n=1 Tax=Citrus x changshan-huyou TaxID=2935761 RepID=A0AAP0QFZ8_9ROSI